MSHIVSPKERANRLVQWLLLEMDFNSAKERAIEMCEMMISEDVNHFKGGERYYYEVYYHLTKYNK